MKGDLTFQTKHCGRCKWGSYIMLEVEGTPRLSWLLSNTSCIWSYHLDLRIFGWTLKRAKNAWHLCSTKLKDVDFYIELFDNKGLFPLVGVGVDFYIELFDNKGLFSNWYDMILYFDLSAARLKLILSGSWGISDTINDAHRLEHLSLRARCIYLYLFLYLK